MKILLIVLFTLLSLPVCSQVDQILSELENRVAPAIPSFKPQKGKSAIIKVSTQDEFDDLQNKLVAILNQNYSHVTVKFAEGTFMFHENQLSLKGVKHPNTSLCFVGEKTIINAIGYEEGIDRGMETETSPDTVDILNVEQKKCRIHLKTVPSEPVHKMQLTEWYLTRFYDIDEIRDGWAYFTAPELFLSNGFPFSWNVNWDWGYCKELPRYRLYSKSNPCQHGCFLRIEHCSLHQLSLSGITFVGNGGRHDLLDLRDLSSQGVFIQQCKFSGLHSRVLNLHSTSGTVFRHNVVEGCYGSCIFSGPGAKGTMVVDNLFKNNSLGLNNTVDVTLFSPDFYVARNKFHNVQYSGISIGYNWAATQEDSVTGIVEYNELWQDADYLAHHRQYSMMDGGPIYVSTRLDDVVVRYNHIHDIAGIRDNRGIFLDDGARNMKIYGNVIHGIHNYYCIDSRLVDHVSSKVQDFNTGNFMAYNLMAGFYKFQGRTDSLENNVKGVNYIALPVLGDLPKNELQHLGQSAVDVYVQQREGRGAYLYVDSRYRQELESCPVWKGMKRWVRFTKY